MSKRGKTIHQSNDDVLDIDIVQEVSTSLQERVQGLQMELIWENLQTKTTCGNGGGGARWDGGGGAGGGRIKEISIPG